MSHVTFKRITAEESRIYQDGDYVGDVYGHEDILNPGSRVGASLRDRATLPSPLRGLDPSGGYPSRLRSLRSLRTPFARRLATLPAAAGTTRSCLGSTVLSK